MVENEIDAGNWTLIKAVNRGIWRIIKLAVLATTLIAGTSCSTTYKAPETTQLAQEDIQDFPYNPAVFHLDLSILAYHLYTQTLIWPFDPYYEDQNNWDWDRSKLLDKVHAWTFQAGANQAKQRRHLTNYSGPGALNGFANNLSHDPIIYRYSQLNPWSNTIVRALGIWTEVRTPQQITDPVRDVYMCSRPKMGSPGQASIERVATKGINSKVNARDVILAFEGETGEKGERGQLGSQSLMGYILMRHWPNSEKYDVHIAFRGSRSGSGARALLQSLNDNDAKGNPDWITDMGYDLLDTGPVRDTVTTHGKVFRGMAHSIAATSPQIFGCLEYVNSIQNGRLPERIFVTGHSLGGGLAQHFVSAVLMGDPYGPTGRSRNLSSNLQQWPWKNIKLVTFAGPRSGDKVWAKTLTETHLKSEFFSTLLNPNDRKALRGNDPAITPRLLRTDIPTGYRFLISRDPITTGKGIEGKHIGKTVYVNKPQKFDMFRLPDVSAHEPLNKRRLLLDSLNDPRIPDWYTKPGQDIPDTLTKKDVGTEAGYRKLKSAYETYYRSQNIPYNQQTFDHDFDLFMSILARD